MEHVRADRERASVLVARLLDVIAQRIFDGDFDVAAMLRASGRRDKNLLTRFAAELGLTPGVYIMTARMRLGARLLAETKLKVWEIAAEVGYGSADSFSRAFKKWNDDEGPTAFRKAARSPAPEPPPPSPESAVSREQIRRALAGDLPPESAEELSGQLYGLGDLVRSGYRELAEAPGQPGPVEPAMARDLWRWIEPLPFEVQLQAVEKQAPVYETPALFHHLCTLSLEARDDRRALRRAALALACVPAVTERLGKWSLNIFARAWAIAGYAQRRAGQLEAAAQSFHAASETLELAGDRAHPVVTAELCIYQASLELERDNYHLADELAGRGFGILDQVVERVLADLPEDGPDEP
ncbi:MAG: helix-turn-helix transcriptional regulator [bacterium]|nr:helix-turn-helix transcriptional regulator [bacterium]